MLSVWVGRAGSGKSRRVLEAMEKNRGLRRQVLLVPEHISHEAEVDLCRALGPTASRDAEVLSFRSLSSRVLAEPGGLAEFTLDNGGTLLTMRRVLQELAPELRVFGRPSQRASFLRQLTDLMEELYAYEIGPRDLYVHVEDLEGAMGDKLRDIALLYAAYDARLRNGDMDARSRLQKLREHLEHSDYLRGCDVYLDGFSYFNRQEESILELVLRQASSVTVTLLGDRGNEQLFQNALRQRMRLERMARRVGQSMEVLWCEKQGSGPLDHLERHFFGRETAYEGQAEGIRLYQAATAFTEVWNGCPSSCGSWRRRAIAGGTWACAPGIWRSTARCWKACSAGTASRPISAAAATCWKSPPSPCCWGHWTPSPAASTGRTCSAA